MSLTRVLGVHFGYRPVSTRALAIRQNTLPAPISFTARLKACFDACAHAGHHRYNAVMVFLRKSPEPNPDYTICAVKGGHFPSDCARAYAEKGFEAVITLDPASGRSFQEEFPDWPIASLHPAHYKSHPHLRVPITINADYVAIHDAAGNVRRIPPHLRLAATREPS